MGDDPTAGRVPDSPVESAKMSAMQRQVAQSGSGLVIGQYGPFAAAIVTISVVVWPIAFNLGAFRAVFYQDLFRFVVIATAGLAVSLLSSHKTGGQRWYVNLGLAGPLIWLTLAATFTDSTADAATNPILGSLALVIGVVSVPTVLKLMADMFVPGLHAYENKRLLFGGLAVLVAMGATGYFVGVNNDFFLNCSDFKVAGSDLPENCDPG